MKRGSGRFLGNEFGGETAQQLPRIFEDFRHEKGAVNQAGPANDFRRDARLLEGDSVGLAFIAEGIEFGGDDERRGNAREIPRAQRGGVRMGAVGFVRNIERPGPLRTGERDDGTGGELGPGRRIERGISDGIEKKLLCEMEIPAAPRDHGGERSTGAVAHDGEAGGIDAESGGVFRNPASGGDAVVRRGGEGVFGSEPVIHGNDDAVGLKSDVAQCRIVGFEIAQAEPSAVKKDHAGESTGNRAVDAERHGSQAVLDRVKVFGRTGESADLSQIAPGGFDGAIAIIHGGHAGEHFSNRSGKDHRFHFDERQRTAGACENRYKAQSNQKPMSAPVSEPESRLNAAWAYQPRAGFYDEMLTAKGEIRPHWQALVDALNHIGPSGLAERWQEGRRVIHDNGVTYNVYGDPQSTERPWPLDPLPFQIEKTEWAAIESAISQRALLLNYILKDLYGPQKLLKEGRIPAELILGHPGFLRPCAGVSPPGDIWLHSYSADIARSPDGNWWVLADRTQAPSGSGYALENRLVSLRVLPDVFRAGNVQRLAPFFQAYKDTLRALAPKRENPRIVLLTPGPFNETWFEHAFLARYLGFTLVEGDDLTVRNNNVYLKTLGGLLPVDVIVRRQDDNFCDPLELRGDSMLGVPGLVQAVWSGNVAVANALGSGLVESSGLAAFLPALSKHVLGEDLRMPNIATWWCGHEAARLQVEERLAHLVIKPATPAHSFEPIFGARLGPKQRELLIRKIRSNPGAYVAQEQVSLSTVPVARDGQLEARHLVLRVFAVASGAAYAVMPGGLTRITSSLDSLVVSMQHGGGSKDTWVLADAPEPPFSLLRRASGPLPVSRATFDLPSRVADNLFWLGRYLERFETAVRAVRVVLPRLYLDPDASTERQLTACRNILAGGGWVKAAEGERLTEAEVLSAITDSTVRTSLRASAKEIRRVARLLRDRISTDAWRVLKQLDKQFTGELPPEALRNSWAQELLDNSMISLAAFSGLATENMTRGHGWRFLDMGRRLERAVQTVQLIRRGLDFESEPTDAELSNILEIADSTLTYRSRYLNSMQMDLVLDLLLLDEGNPRSAAFQLSKLRKHVDRLPESHPPSGTPREARLALKLLTSVQLAETEELVKLSYLDELTAKMEEDLGLLSDTISRVYFTHQLRSQARL